MNATLKFFILTSLLCAAGLSTSTSGTTTTNPPAITRRPLCTWGTNPASIIVDDIPDSGTDLGSGVEFWPAEGVFLVLDNNARQLRRVTPAGALTGAPVTLTNFWDPEEIRLIDPARHLFAISQEFRSKAAPNEIVVIVVPQGATELNRNDAVRILQPVLKHGGDIEIGTTINSGYEAMAWKDGRFYFCLEKPSRASASREGFWNVWSVPDTAGEGTTPATPEATLCFPLLPLLSGRATDVASMCFTPWGTLILACDEGTGTIRGSLSNQAGRLVEVTMKGQLVDDTPPPVLNNGRHMRQLEGICFRQPAGGNPLQLVLTGEPNGTAGTDWMVLP